MSFVTNLRKAGLAWSPGDHFMQMLGEGLLLYLNEMTERENFSQERYDQSNRELHLFAAWFRGVLEDPHLKAIHTPQTDPVDLRELLAAVEAAEDSACLCRDSRKVYDLVHELVEGNGG